MIFLNGGLGFGGLWLACADVSRRWSDAGVDRIRLTGSVVGVEHREGCGWFCGVGVLHRRWLRELSVMARPVEVAGARWDVAPGRSSNVAVHDKITNEHSGRVDRGPRYANPICSATRWRTVWGC